MASRRTTHRLIDRQRRERRDHFAEQTPRAAKRALGATTTTETPMHVRAIGVVLEGVERAYVRERTSFKLGKFGLAITRLSIRFEDVSGPKGATVIACRIKVVLRTAPDVVVSADGDAPRAAFDRAVTTVERTVRRTLGKSQTTRTRGRMR